MVRFLGTQTLALFYFPKRYDFLTVVFKQTFKKVFTETGNQRVYILQKKGGWEDHSWTKTDNSIMFCIQSFIQLDIPNYYCNPKKFIGRIFFIL